MRSLETISFNSPFYETIELYVLSFFKWVLVAADGILADSFERGLGIVFDFIDSMRIFQT